MPEIETIQNVVDTVIALPTYKAWDRVEHFLTSVHTITDPADLDDHVKFVVLDDGTSAQPGGIEIVDRLREVCSQFDVPLIIHPQNEGIPKSWNDLTRYYPEAQKIILFNDDISICNPHWLKCMRYFLDNNEMVGSVGFPLVHMNPMTHAPMEPVDPSKWGTRPGRVGAAVGCCFGFKKAHWAQVKNFDQSIGLCEALISFHEEIMLGMEFARLGYRSYMLHYPSVSHWRSRTFSLNPELAWCKLDERWISKEEYIRLASKCSHSVNFWKGYSGNGTTFMTPDGLVDRMSYSRILYSRFYGCPEEEIDNPMVYTHKKFVDPLEPVLVKWLDENLNPTEGMIPS